MVIASLRSILALKPPFTHSSAALLPENSPRRISDLPTSAAVTAPIPIMMGVDMPTSLDIPEEGCDYWVTHQAGLKARVHRPENPTREPG